MSLVFAAAACNKTISKTTDVASTPAYKYDKGTIQLAGTTLSIDVAKNEAEREKGLSGQTLLYDDQGLLFIFPSDGMHAFWMKDMQFPIDIIWLEDGVVVYMVQNAPNVPNAQSDADYPIYTPEKTADQVLEVQAGWVRTHGLKIGDNALITFK